MFHNFGWELPYAILRLFTHYYASKSVQGSVLYVIPRKKQAVCVAIQHASAHAS